MNIVIQTLKAHIGDQNVRFVFPSQIAANLWARKTCTLGITRSLASKRFLAWDSFKEETIQEREKERKPVSLVMRKLFAEALVRKNAETQILKSIIPPEYAKGGAVFAPFIARLLPSLKHWETLMQKSQSRKWDAEDEDYETVKKEYEGFLERHRLFEPPWEELKIREGSSRYVLFFPELIEDFFEYEALLPAPQFIRIAAEMAVSRAEQCLVFQSAREEIRSAVMELRRLHDEEGFPYEDMAVSVPELEEMEAVLIKEFALHSIPVTRRFGRKLGETGAGRLFSLLNECAASSFSFNSLKALILNDHIPWKEREKNKALVNFGIKYNCVSAYFQNGKTVDIWEEAFKEARNDESRELGPYYRELKKRTIALGGAKNFSEIRKRYFAFRSGFLDMEKISIADNAVLSRCIEELSSLIELEEEFDDPSLVPASPFGFFLSCLGEKEYVRAGQEPGVNIFKWRVAAASPFSCHFVLNASQSAAPVLYQPMRFLRQDKRKALGLEDRDATWAFFLLCNTGEDEDFKSRTRISASVLTFSGWAIPHSFFAGGKTVEAPRCSDDTQHTQDFYAKERCFWREGTALQKIFLLQKNSFDVWKNSLTQRKNDFSFFNSPVPSNGASAVRELLENAILGSDGCLTVTPTRDLNVYYSCSLAWLYGRIFGAEEYSLEASLLDDTALGILYHRILEKLFSKIRDEERAFDARRLDSYKHWALEITREAIKKESSFKGPLAIPLVSPQAAGMAKKIAGLLELEAKNFNGYRVLELELPVSLKTGELFIKGIIDRVSLSPNGEPVIIDYKTSYLPRQTVVEDLDEVSLSEFQMPLYIKLYEEKTAIDATGGSAKVQGAFFYSINGRELKPVMKATNRDEYDPFLEAAEKQIEEFGRKVKALDFTPEEIKIKDCLGCVYKTACRSAYF